MEKKRRYAAALGYLPEREEAPKLLAKGEGFVAERIVETAREAGVSVYQDEKLAKQLQHLEMGEEIPVELYDVVASVLSFIARIDKRYSSK